MAFEIADQRIKVRYIATRNQRRRLICVEEEVIRYAANCTMAVRAQFTCGGDNVAKIPVASLKITVEAHQHQLAKSTRDVPLLAFVIITNREDVGSQSVTF